MLREARGNPGGEALKNGAIGPPYQVIRDGAGDGGGDCHVEAEFGD
jgi:hypothetical protein